MTGGRFPTRHAPRWGTSLLGGAAVLLTAGLAALPAAEVPRLRGLLALFAVAATGATVVAVVTRWRVAVTGAIALVVAGYALSLAGDELVDVSAPLRAAGLVAVVELVVAAHRSYAGRTDPAVAVRDVLLAVVHVGGAWLLAAGVLLTAAAPVEHGTLVVAAGIGAATAIVALLGTLLRTGGGRPPPPRR